MRLPQRGFVQVGLYEVISALCVDAEQITGHRKVTVGFFRLKPDE
jgi:hypothetical protein